MSLLLLFAPQAEETTSTGGQNYLVDASARSYCGNTYAAVGMPIFYSGAEFQLQRLQKMKNKNDTLPN